MECIPRTQALRLSGRLMKRLVLAFVVADDGTFYYSENGISMIVLQQEKIVTVVLRINSTGFQLLKANTTTLLVSICISCTLRSHCVMLMKAK